VDDGLGLGWWWDGWGCGCHFQWVMQELMVGEVSHGFGSSAEDGGVAPAYEEGKVGKGTKETSPGRLGMEMPSFRIL